MSNEIAGEIELARATGNAAFKIMAKYNIAPIPENYALLYLYASGTNEALTAEVERLINRNEISGAFALTDLYSRYVAKRENVLQFDEAGAKMQAEMDRVLAMVAEAERGAKAYGVSLTNANAGLGGPKPPLTEIVASLIRSTHEMQNKNQRLEESLHGFTDEVAGLRENLAKARREANTDALTQLANRKGFEDNVKMCTESSARDDAPLALLFGDVDHFKQFNDQYGHALGDQVLRIVAKSISENIPSRAMAARFGGDEFAILFPDTDITAAVMIADRIRRTIESRKIIKRTTGEQLSKITTSMGISIYVPGESVAQFVARADAALYAAKAGGRNRVATEVEAKSSGLKSAEMAAH